MGFCQLISYIWMSKRFAAVHFQFSVNITKTCLFKYTENFTSIKKKNQKKYSDNFHISAQNIDCGYSLEPPQRGDSNKYSQSMFLSRNKKNSAYPCKPQFYYIKGGLRGSKLYRHVFLMISLLDPDFDMHVYWHTLMAKSLRCYLRRYTAREVPKGNTIDKQVVKKMCCRFQDR